MSLNRQFPFKHGSRASGRPPEDFQKGVALHKLGKFVEAIDCYDKAIRVNSKIAEIHYSRGVALRKINRSSEALKSYEIAIQIRRNYPEAHYNIANILRDRKDYPHALDRYNDAIRFNPKFAEAYSNRGVIFKALNRFQDALKDFDTAISLKPDYAAAFYNRGNVLIELGSVDLAIASFDNAIDLDPHQAEYLYNRGNALREALRFEEALHSYCEAIRRRPNYADAYSNRGTTFYRLKRMEEALRDFSQAQKIEPGNAEIHWNESLCRLALGDFDQGWDHYEWRLKERSFQNRSLAGHADIAAAYSTRNTAADFMGKTVFVASEQGIGDHVMFMSILPELLRDAGSVICQLDPRLIKLFERCYPAARYVPRGDIRILETVAVDLHIRMGSLAYPYRRDRSCFPGTPYLTPDPARVAQWQSRINSEPGKLKVGVSWRGGSPHTNGADRSMALEDLAPLLDREDYQFISLQHGDVDAEIAAFNATRTNKLVRFPKNDLNDFEDFAGLVGALDCVVSVDNTNIHLGGALGKPCFAMLPHRCDWRYGISEDTMPWYRSVKLFRQIHDGNWSDVIENIDRELIAFKP